MEIKTTINLTDEQRRLIIESAESMEDIIGSKTETIHVMLSCYIEFEGGGKAIMSPKPAGFEDEDMSGDYDDDYDEWEDC